MGLSEQRVLHCINLLLRVYLMRVKSFINLLRMSRIYISQYIPFPFVIVSSDRLEYMGLNCLDAPPIFDLD